MTAINVSNLALSRKNGFQLGPLSLELKSGAKTALIGPSGSGKTTLLRCLAGLERPTQGTVHFGERQMNGPGVCAQPQDRRIGFVFQDGALWPHLTAEKQLRFVEPSLTEARAVELLARVGLADLAKRRPGSMSGGEGQRLALARALAGAPEVLMLDEPLHSVDVHLRDELALLIRRVAEESSLTLLVVTHDREEALAIADELVVLRSGQVVECGSVAELLRSPRTAFAARFVCRAACLEATPESDGRLRTLFGVHDGVEAAIANDCSLVLMPGDLRIVTDAAAPRGRVLQVVPNHAGGEGFLATVNLDGKPVLVTCDSTLNPGSEVALGLRGEPRFLSSDQSGKGSR